MITHISEKETQLVSMLRKTGEALDACTAERDALKAGIFNLAEADKAALDRMTASRDTYQVEADRLAWENKTLRDMLEEINSWLVCSCIATADDMAQSFDHMQKVADAALGANHD